MPTRLLWHFTGAKIIYEILLPRSVTDHWWLWWPVLNKRSQNHGVEFFGAKFPQPGLHNCSPPSHSPSHQTHNQRRKFPKIVSFPPKSSMIFIGISMIFTIHFGVFPLFLETPKWKSISHLSWHFLSIFLQIFRKPRDPAGCHERRGPIIEKIEGRKGSKQFKKPYTFWGQNIKGHISKASLYSWFRSSRIKEYRNSRKDSFVAHLAVGSFLVQPGILHTIFCAA